MEDTTPQKDATPPAGGTAAVVSTPGASAASAPVTVSVGTQPNWPLYVTGM